MAPINVRIEGQELVRKTLVTMGVMLGAAVAFVGTLSLLVAVVVGRAVGSPALSEPAAAGAEKGPGTSTPTPAGLPRGGAAQARHTESI